MINYVYNYNIAKLENRQKWKFPSSKQIQIVINEIPTVQ